MANFKPQKSRSNAPRRTWVLWPALELILPRARFTFQPEIRYTHRGKANFSSSNGVLGSNLNCVDVLVGVTFRKE